MLKAFKAPHVLRTKSSTDEASRLRLIHELQEELRQKTKSYDDHLPIELIALKSEISHKAHEIRHLEQELKASKDMSDRLSERVLEDAAGTKTLKAEHNTALEEIVSVRAALRRAQAHAAEHSDAKHSAHVEKLVVQILILKKDAERQAAEICEAKHHAQAHEAKIQLLKKEAERHTHELFHAREQHTETFQEMKIVKEQAAAQATELAEEKKQHTIAVETIKTLKEETSRHEAELLTIGELQNRKIKEENKRLALELEQERAEHKKVLESVRCLKAEAKCMQLKLDDAKVDISILEARNKVSVMEIEQAKREEKRRLEQYECAACPSKSC